MKSTSANPSITTTSSTPIYKSQAGFFALDPNSYPITPILSLVWNFGQTLFVRGGFIAALVAGSIAINASRYSRIGALRKKYRFIRRIIERKRKPDLIPFSDYFYPNLKTVTKNFMCFSGQSGIGKSYHFQYMAYQQSFIRPVLYLSFKSTGVGPTFQYDLVKKLDYGPYENPPMFSQIIQAVKFINNISTNRVSFWRKVAFAHAGFVLAALEIIQRHLLQSTQSLFLSIIGGAYAYYFYIMYPLMMQTVRRTKPLIIFDDLNKITSVNKLAEISRYLYLLDQNMANVILVSSDQETWFRLRKEPDMRDRLRQRILDYNPKLFAENFIHYLSVDKNYKQFLDSKRISPLLNRQLVIALIRQLVGNRQATMRRLASILVLNDQQQYQRYFAVIQAYKANQLTAKQTVDKFTQIMYQSQTSTLCAKLKHIKRMLPLSQQQYISQLGLLLQKGKLPSDNKIAPLLMTYSIVRDLKSQYVFNGKFMYGVFAMAYRDYVRDLKQFRNEKVEGQEGIEGKQGKQGK